MESNNPKFVSFFYKLLVLQFSSKLYDVELTELNIKYNNSIIFEYFNIVS